jgi:ubiquinone/menaquinone biosynthesis C-methylase UbiE
VPGQPEHGRIAIADWHRQFLRQARWTQATRSHLYRRANLLRATQVLDVGCGTGVVTAELAQRTQGSAIGIDVDPQMIAFARQQGGKARYEEGDAGALPFPTASFDIAACHFTLMWIADPQAAVREMARVVRPGGTVLVCAEPDYGGRLDWPALPIRRWQVEGLRRQGADACIGRRLRQILSGAELEAEVGVIPSQWAPRALEAEFEAEWSWLRRDVGDAIELEVFEQAMAEAKAAIQEGTRFVYVPIFYALGRVGR